MLLPKSSNSVCVCVCVCVCSNSVCVCVCVCARVLVLHRYLLLKEFWSFPDNQDYFSSWKDCFALEVYVPDSKNISSHPSSKYLWFRKDESLVREQAHLLSCSWGRLFLVCQLSFIYICIHIFINIYFQLWRMILLVYIYMNILI